jgi:hypothetical protein
MIDAAVTVNTIQFEAAMQRLRKGVRSGLIDPMYGTLTVQGRLLAERCQSLTPPRSLAQGRKAVARDIDRAFQPLKPEDFRSPSIQRIIRKDDREAWDAAAKNFGSRNLKDSRAIGFNPRHHINSRRSRGRVQRTQGVVTLGPQATRVRQYIREVQQRVGWAKGGWNRGIMALGGRIKDAWFGRHGIARGQITDGRQAADPFIRVANDTTWGKDRAQSERIVRAAIGMRARDMVKYLETQMRLAAVKAGFAKAA